MKKVSLISLIPVFLLFIMNCNNSKDNHIKDKVEISINSESEIVKKDASNLLTVNIKNNNNKNVKISKAACFLEFTAEPYGYTHILSLNNINKEGAEELLHNGKLSVEANKTLKRRIDMKKVLQETLENSDKMLADGDYWVRFVLETRSNKGNKTINESIKSNLVEIKVMNNL